MNVKKKFATIIVAMAIVAMASSAFAVKRFNPATDSKVIQAAGGSAAGVYHIIIDNAAKKLREDAGVLVVTELSKGTTDNLESIANGKKQLVLAMGLMTEDLDPATYHVQFVEGLGEPLFSVMDKDLHNRLMAGSGDEDVVWPMAMKNYTQLVFVAIGEGSGERKLLEDWLPDDATMHVVKSVPEMIEFINQTPNAIAMVGRYPLPGNSFFTRVGAAKNLVLGGVMEGSFKEYPSISMTELNMNGKKIRTLQSNIAFVTPGNSIMPENMRDDILKVQAEIEKWTAKDVAPKLGMLAGLKNMFKNFVAVGFATGEKWAKAAEAKTRDLVFK